MSKQDHLSNGVSVEAAIEGKGVSLAAKSRAVAAFDRLLGGLLDIPSAWLENIAEKKRLKGQMELQSLVEQADAGCQTDVEKEQLQKVVEQQLVPFELSKLSNKAKIVEKSLEHLQGEDQFEEGEVDVDWLNYFEEYAEKASSERMQDVWARVLAGEIRKPKTFSLSTIRFLSELDAEMAQTFQRVCENWLDIGFILQPAYLEGNQLLDYTFLEEVGLLQEVNGNLKNNRKPGEDGHIYWREGNLLLKLECKSQIGTPLIRITRIGREILKLLPPRDLKKTLKAVAAVHLDSVTSAQIHMITREHPDGSVEYLQLETLK